MSHPITASATRLPRVLLAEDNPINRHIALAMLKTLPLDIHTVGNGALAVQAVRQERFELVLMDCEMPEMDGFEAARAIRQWLPARDLPIIALTANNTSGDFERCMAAGMNAYLPKPFSKDKLLGMVTRWVRPSQNGLWKEF